MARLPRLYAPAAPIGASQFHPALAAPSQPAPADILNQLATWLGESAQRHRVSVHAWLLADRILLLATPADEEGLPRLMQTLGRNLAARCAGRVAGRYRSALLEPGAWVLPSQVWLETYPVRSGVAGSRFLALVLGQQPYRQHQRAARWQSDHADYWACGNAPFDRQANYQAPAGRPVARGIPTHRPGGVWPVGAGRPRLHRQPGPHRQPPGRAGTARTSAQNQPRPRQPGTLLKRRPRL